MALRGRDTTVSLSTGLLEQVLEGDDVVSFSWQNRQDVIGRRHFGQSHDHHEERFKDVMIKMKLNHKNPTVLQFLVNISSRGRQETSGMVVKATTKYKMPNGETNKILFNDIKFEGAGMDSDDRESNVSTELVGYCHIAEPLTSIV